MSPFTVYDTLTGKILSTGSAKYPLDQGLGPGKTTIDEYSNAKQQYVDVLDGSIKNKTAMGLTVDKVTLSADGVDKVTISGIPAGTGYSLKGGSGGVVNDGVLEFTADIPRAYYLVFNNVLHLTEEVTLVAT